MSAIPQCEFVQGGDRCVFGTGHTCDYHLCGGRKVHADGRVDSYLAGMMTDDDFIGGDSR